MSRYLNVAHISGIFRKHAIFAFYIILLRRAIFLYVYQQFTFTYKLDCFF